MINFPYIGTVAIEDAIISLQERFPNHSYKIHQDGYVTKKRKTGETFERVCLHNKKPHVCRFCKTHYAADETIIRKGCVKPLAEGPLPQEAADPFFGRKIAVAPVISGNFTAELIDDYSKILQFRGIVVNENCIIFDKTKPNSWNIRVNFLEENYSLQHLSWMLATNRFIPDGFVIRHTCRTEGCYSAKHLEIGTQRQNMFEDKIRDGTLRFGENHHAATISGSTALAIYFSKGQGTKQQRADRFGISFGIVKKIDRGETWGWLTGCHKGRNKLRENQQIRRDNIPRSFATPQQYQKLVETIMARSNVIADTGCIEPDQAKDHYGYTFVCLNGHHTKAHIVMWEYYHNDCTIKDENMVVRHKCDNPSCCNPDHLEIGTVSDNIKDQYNRNRRQKRSARPTDTAHEDNDESAKMIRVIAINSSDATSTATSNDEISVISQLHIDFQKIDEFAFSEDE